MGIELVSGRDFTDLDLPTSEAVIIVNETLARHYWPGEDATGKRITLDDPRANPLWMTIIGVAKDVKQESWIGPPSNEVYIAFQQSRGFLSSTSRAFTSMTLVARSSVEAETLIPAITREVRSLDGNIPVSNIVSMEQVIGDAIWQQRFNTQLIGLFAFGALVLAAVGLYGVMSYSVIQRRQEVGLRMALGAQRRDVIRLIVGSGMKLVVIGVAAGLLASIALTRLMSNLLFEVDTLDVTTFLTVAGALVLVALFACLIPALRASRVAPRYVVPPLGAQTIGAWGRQ